MRRATDVVFEARARNTRKAVQSRDELVPRAQELLELQRPQPAPIRLWDGPCAQPLREDLLQRADRVVHVRDPVLLYDPLCFDLRRIKSAPMNCGRRARGGDADLDTAAGDHGYAGEWDRGEVVCGFVN